MGSFAGYPLWICWLRLWRRTVNASLDRATEDQSLKRRHDRLITVLCFIGLSILGLAAAYLR